MVVLFQAEEAEQNFNEDDGWEFVTLADQVRKLMQECAHMFILYS